VLGIIVAEDEALGLGVADALDHRGVVERIGEHAQLGSFEASVPSEAQLET
jgi:hypothetical protein